MSLLSILKKGFLEETYIIILAAPKCAKSTEPGKTLTNVSTSYWAQQAWFMPDGQDIMSLDVVHNI